MVEGIYSGLMQASAASRMQPRTPRNFSNPQRVLNNYIAGGDAVMPAPTGVGSVDFGTVLSSLLNVVLPGRKNTVTAPTVPEGLGDNIHNRVESFLDGIFSFVEDQLMGDGDQVDIDQLTMDFKQDLSAFVVDTATDMAGDFALSGRLPVFDPDMAFASDVEIPVDPLTGVKNPFQV